MSCFSSLLNIKLASPTTFTTRISHCKGTVSPFLHNVYSYACPQGRCLGKGKRVLSTKRQNAERGREGVWGIVGSKGIQYSMRPFECPSEDFRQCQELRKLYLQQVKALKAVRSPREMIYNISRMESRNTNRDTKRRCQRRLRTVKRRREKIQGWREYKGW